MWDMFKDKKQQDHVSPDGEVITFFGEAAHFKGSLTYEGTVRIDGEFEGDITTQGTLIIGEHGIINAEIVAGTVIVGGRINGNLRAEQKVQMLDKSVVTGTIVTPSIIVEDGALLNGACEMKRSVVLQPEERKMSLLS